MRNRLGKACVRLGVVLVLGALALFSFNQLQARRAREASQEALERIVLHYSQTVVPEETGQTQPPESDSPSAETAQTPEAFEPDPASMEMTVVEIDGYGYVGCLSIPDLGKQLPIMSEWDYERLKLAPCRYMGGVRTNDLVICAHNYESHFADLSSLTLGARVIITDMDGFVTAYEVAEITELPATAIEEMESGEYPLTLFTCTYGGQARIAVRCEKVI